MRLSSLSVGKAADSGDILVPTVPDTPRDHGQTRLRLNSPLETRPAWFRALTNWCNSHKRQAMVIELNLLNTACPDQNVRQLKNYANLCGRRGPRRGA